MSTAMDRVNIADPDLAADPTGIEGFRAGMVRLGKLLSSEDCGISIYEMPSGQAVCPYHYKLGEEEC